MPDDLFQWCVPSLIVMHSDLCSHPLTHFQGCSLVFISTRSLSCLPTHFCARPLILFPAHLFTPVAFVYSSLRLLSPTFTCPLVFLRRPFAITKKGTSFLICTIYSRIFIVNSHTELSSDPTMRSNLAALYDTPSAESPAYHLAVIDTPKACTRTKMVR